MFNTMGGRSLLVGRGYGTGAGVGQGTAPMPAGYYRPGSEYNWYSYASGDPINFADAAGYQKWRTQLAWALVLVALEIPTAIGVSAAILQPELIVPIAKGIEYYHYFIFPLEIYAVYKIATAEG